MKLKLTKSKTLGRKWRIAKKHLSSIPLLVWLNSLTLLLLGLLSFYAKVKSKGRGVERLFSDPFDDHTFYLGWLTGVSEILWCVIIAICAFTLSLLPPLRHQSRRFLRASALLLSILFFDDRFRLTLIISALANKIGVSSTIVEIGIYFLYGSLLVIYIRQFWKIIRRTPYLPLIVGFLLFVFSSVVDLTPIYSPGTHAMLEDGSKLLGQINIALYFWYVCKLEVQRALSKGG